MTRGETAPQRSQVTAAERERGGHMSRHLQLTARAAATAVCSTNDMSLRPLRVAASCVGVVAQDGELDAEKRKSGETVFFVGKKQGYHCALFLKKISCGAPHARRRGLRRRRRWAIGDAGVGDPGSHCLHVLPLCGRSLSPGKRDNDAVRV